MTMIIGIQFLCLDSELCKMQGPQTTAEFSVSRDEDGFPCIAVRCMTCNKIHHLTFVC